MILFFSCGRNGLPNDPLHEDAHFSFKCTLPKTIREEAGENQLAFDITAIKHAVKRTEAILYSCNTGGCRFRTAVLELHFQFFCDCATWTILLQGCPELNLKQNDVKTGTTEIITYLWSFHLIFNVRF